MKQDDLSQILKDAIDKMQNQEEQIKNLKLYVKITKESFLEHGFSTDSIVIKQADKLLKE